MTFDPTNKFDKNAIKVLSGSFDKPCHNHHLGFVARHTAAIIANKIAAVLQDMEISSEEFDTRNIMMEFKMIGLIDDYGVKPKAKFVRCEVYI